MCKGCVLESFKHTTLTKAREQGDLCQFSLNMGTSNEG